MILLIISSSFVRIRSSVFGDPPLVCVVWVELLLVDKVLYAVEEYVGWVIFSCS